VKCPICGEPTGFECQACHYPLYREAEVCPKGTKEALRELARCARTVDAKHHAGGPVHMEDWSLLYDAVNAARAILDKAGE